MHQSHKFKMAIIEVEGVVKKINSSSFTVAERICIPGYDFEKMYTVWSEEKPTMGIKITVRGKLNMKIKKYEDKTFVDVSINDPIISLG